MNWLLDDTFGIVFVGFFFVFLLLCLGAGFYYYMPKLRDSIPERDKLDYDVDIDSSKSIVIRFNDKHSDDNFKAVIYVSPVPCKEDRLHITSLSDERTYSFFISPDLENGIQFGQLRSLLLSVQHMDSYSYVKGDRTDDLNMLMDLFQANELNRSGSCDYYTKDFGQALINGYFELKTIIGDKNESKIKDVHFNNPDFFLTSAQR